MLNAYWWDGFISSFMGYNPVADINLPGGDGFVGLFDLALIQAQWLDYGVPAW